MQLLLKRVSTAYNVRLSFLNYSMLCEKLCENVKKISCRFYYFRSYIAFIFNKNTIVQILVHILIYYISLIILEFFDLNI